MKRHITMENIRNRLDAKGISPSIHRVKVLEYLMTYDNHPTVQQIYSYLASDIPTLSKTTVYNVLNLYKEHNLVKELIIEGTEIRYDAHLAPHAHFKCNQCEEVLNINYQCPMFNHKFVDGHTISHRQVNFIGTCARCAEIAKKETA
jgi:Fur family peroxide stress response transcriptional regulator